MPSSISFKEGTGTVVVNVEQVCFAIFSADKSVTILFASGDKNKFTELTDREQEQLKRMLRITPA